MADNAIPKMLEALAELEALDGFKVISVTHDGNTVLAKAGDVLADGDRLMLALHISDVPRLKTIFRR